MTNHFTGEKGGFIICALRSMPKEHCVEMTQLAAQFMGRGVVGMDVAGDEGSFPLNSRCHISSSLFKASSKTKEYIGKFFFIFLAIVP